MRIADYNLQNTEDALDKSVRDPFKKKLEERLENPRAPSAKLSGGNDRYKIKLRNAGYEAVGKFYARS